MREAHEKWAKYVIAFLPSSLLISRNFIWYLFRSTWASLIAQLVKNPPAMQETLVRFLGGEDPLEKG